MKRKLIALLTVAILLMTAVCAGLAEEAAVVPELTDEDVIGEWVMTLMRSGEQTKLAEDAGLNLLITISEDGTCELVFTKADGTEERGPGVWHVQEGFLLIDMEDGGFAVIAMEEGCLIMELSGVEMILEKQAEETEGETPAA